MAGWPLVAFHMIDFLSLYVRCLAAHSDEKTALESRSKAKRLDPEELALQ
jgi:hypothetical protein